MSLGVLVACGTASSRSSVASGTRCSSPGSAWAAPCPTPWTGCWRLARALVADPGLPAGRHDHRDPGTFGNPFGTAGSVAYSQYANLPLLQLVSVTGIWGLTFLVSWLAPVVNELWERGLSPRAARVVAAVLFVAALCAALVFGGIRLAFPGPDAATVRVAALAPDRELSDLAYAAPSGGARNDRGAGAVAGQALRARARRAVRPFRARGQGRRQDHRLVGGGGAGPGGGPAGRRRPGGASWPRRSGSTCRSR